MCLVTLCILRDIKSELLSVRNLYLNDYQVMILKYTQLLWTSSKVIKHLKYAILHKNLNGKYQQFNLKNDCFVHVYLTRKTINYYKRTHETLKHVRSPKTYLFIFSEAKRLELGEIKFISMDVREFDFNLVHLQKKKLLMYCCCYYYY